MSGRIKTKLVSCYRHMAAYGVQYWGGRQKSNTDSEKITNILESTTDAFFATDDNWKFTYLNRRAIKFFDCKGTLIGKELWDTYPEFASSFYKKLTQVNKNKVAIDFEGYYPPSNSWLEIHAYPIDDGIAIYFRDITDRINSELALQESEAQKRAVLDSVADGIVVTNSHGHIQIFNPAAENMFGYNYEEVVNKNITMLMPEEYRTNHDSNLSKYLHAGIPASVGLERELIACKKNGTEFPVDIRIGKVDIDNEIMFIASVRDITDRKRVEKKLRLADMVFENTEQGIIITDADTKILRTNKAFSKITQYHSDEIIGLTPKVLNSGKQDKDFYNDFWKILKEEGQWSGEIWNRRKGGEVYPEWLSIRSIKDQNGCISNYVGIFTDLSQIKKQEEQIHYLSHFDALTGLANRLLFEDRLGQALIQSESSKRALALLHINIDQFKKINDTFGYLAGDVLIKEVKDRLARCLLEVDSIARIGGDEFNVILRQLNNIQDAGLIANKLLRQLSEVYSFNDQEIFISASIGIALFPYDADTGEDLMKHARAAMYHCKQHGKNSYHFYTEDMNVAAHERITLESKLYHAIEQNEFVLHYQPQINSKTGNIVGAEALIRWEHPELGQIPPNKFIPLLEESGLIVQVGEWTLRKACLDNKHLQDEGHQPFTVAVNLSPLQFKQTNIVQTVNEILIETELEPQWLELEITESSIMENEGENITILNNLKDLGVKLSIDDFGTGYSSLSYLKRFPIDTLKIDKSFVSEVTTHTGDAAIAKTIITLAHSLNLRTVAEGVETEEQLEFFKKQSCDVIQGYLYSKPLPAAQFLEYINNKPRNSGLSNTHFN